MLDSLHDTRTLVLWAIAVGLLAIVAATIALIRACYRIWRAQRAARALLTTHLRQLDDAALRTARKLDPLALHAEDAMRAASDLRKSISTLTSLLRAIPEQRDRLRTALLDVVLPSTRAGSS